MEENIKKDKKVKQTKKYYSKNTNNKKSNNQYNKYNKSNNKQNNKKYYSKNNKAKNKKNLKEENIVQENFLKNVDEVDLTKSIEELEKLEIQDVEIKKKKDIEKKHNRRKKAKKEKKKLSLGGKTFIFINLLVIFAIIGFYAYRTVFYYKLTHEIKGDETLVDIMTRIDNIAFQNDGLYEEDNTFYFKGSNVNNYVYYSGRMWRIISISDSIRMIEDETNTNLIWNMEGHYENSPINLWLNNYLESLKDYDIYLNESSWCNSSININNYSCVDTIKGYVGLLSTEEYLKAGGKNSFLNNYSYFWTINQDNDGNTLFVNKDGGINNISFKDNMYYSYGIRPVINMNNDVMYIEGSGTKDDPYIIDNSNNILLRDNSVGSYVKYYDYLFRIISIDEDGITIMMNDTLDDTKKYSELDNYLNKEFIKHFNTDDLVKMTYYVNEYNINNNYGYNLEKNKKSNYITIPSIGTLFLNNAIGYWLNNIQDSKLGLYYVLDNNYMFYGDLSGNKNKVRPVLKLNNEIMISNGIGTMDDPLIIGE